MNMAVATEIKLVQGGRAGSTGARRITLSRLALACGILLVGADMRAPLTSVAPLLHNMQSELSLKASEIGMLTTLPLVMLAAASPLIGLGAKRYGLERTLSGGLVFVVLGIVVRSSGMVLDLFVGTAMIGLGVAGASVLLPSLMKKYFPDSIPVLTCAYSLTAGIVAGFFSAAVVPISDLPHAGWRVALAAALPISLLAAAFWTIRSKRTTTPVGAMLTTSFNRNVWRSPLAWQVSLFYGLNSMVYNAIGTWLPSILLSLGCSGTAAGSLHGLTQLTTSVPALFMAPLISRGRDLRLAAVLVSCLIVLPLFGLLMFPSLAIAWVAAFGLGIGATLLLSFAFIGLRASDPEEATALSGMSQTVGYLLAAVASPIMGCLHDSTGSWSAGLLLCAVLSLGIGMAGFYAGRTRTLSSTGISNRLDLGQKMLKHALACRKRNVCAAAIPADRLDAACGVLRR